MVKGTILNAVSNGNYPLILSRWMFPSWVISSHLLCHQHSDEWQRGILGRALCSSAQLMPLWYSVLWTLIPWSPQTLSFVSSSQGVHWAPPESPFLHHGLGNLGSKLERCRVRLICFSSCRNHCLLLLMSSVLTTVVSFCIYMKWTNKHIYFFWLFQLVGKSNPCYFTLGILTDENWSSCLRSSYENCHWCQFSSVSQSCPTLCDPMDCSTPGLPVHHQLLELAQTHVHRVGDAIQPSHPL